MLDTELAAAKGGPILHIPLVLGARRPHLQRQGRRRRASTSTVRRSARSSPVRSRSGTTRPSRSMNPKAQLPDETIAVVHRSDGSGTTAVFTDFLTKTSPDWVAKLGGADESFGKTVAWPVGIGGKGNDGVAALVGQTEGAIGYVELQYAISAQAHRTPTSRTRTGTFITPCIATLERGRAEDLVPAGPAHQPDLAPAPDRLPDHGHDVRARLPEPDRRGQGQGARQLPLLGADDRPELPGLDQLRPDGQDPAAEGARRS